MMKRLFLRFNVPAENTLEGWEKYSLPLGNGYFGMSVFGGTDVECLQFTTNVFANTYKQGGVSNFAEVYLHFNHNNTQNYERGLCLNTGNAYTVYELNGVKVQRNAFVSYPDKVAAYRVCSEKGMDFSVELALPYLNSRSIEEGGRVGEVSIEDGCLVMRGSLPSRNLIFEGRLGVITDGELTEKEGKLFVSKAKDSTVLFTLDTSYKLCKEVFLNGCHKALGDDPHEKTLRALDYALKLGWDKLYERHLSDYTELMGRVVLDLGGKDDGKTTEELLESYRKGNREPYLEEVYYQYGRHLLVSSSRKGTPPASLQGVWSAHDKSPWGSGFWHNINVQMNYWPAFSTNLAETFEAYTAFNQAFRAQAEILASDWISEIVPENYVEGRGACGWSIGVASFCYEIEGPSKHSGPGTGGLTTQLFWDYYDYTRDETVLREVTYPAIHGMAKFLTKCVRDYDGEYLAAHSASPEQIIGGKWITQAQVPPSYRSAPLKCQPYYHTVGCAFDQQMLYENAKNDLKCAEILGVSDEITELEKRQISSYSPVLIGYSGQIKEYREEKFYGEIGEAKHRHISQLVGVCPGSLVNYSTPAWQDAAKKTLELRGDESTGWALAHRLCAWARTGDGEHAYSLLKTLWTTRTHPNLWDVHPPFQIDGNFGALSGMTEMLLQSYDDCIHLLPALPAAWKNVSFKGLKARGNFTVSCIVKEGKIQNVEIESVKGGFICVHGHGMQSIWVTDTSGKNVKVKNTDISCAFSTVAGERYTLTGFSQSEPCQKPTFLRAEFGKEAVFLTWKGNADKYAVYRAVNDDSGYRLLGYTDKTQFTDVHYNDENKARLTYRVTAVTGEHTNESEGVAVFLSPATRLEIERYSHVIRQNNVT